MLHYLRRNGFELEKAFPGYFLLQGGAAGIVVGILTFLYTLILTSSSRSEHDSLNWMALVHLLDLVYGLLFYVLFSVFLCVVLSTTLRFPSWLLNRRMKIVTRIVTVTILTSGLFIYLFRLDKQEMSERNLILIVIAAALVSIPTGSLCGSSIRLWKMFSFGTVMVRSTEFKWRVSSANRFATAAMFPIRFFSVLGLTIWSVIITCLWQTRHDSSGFLAGSGFIVVYLLLSLYLSYRSPRHWILIVISCLLNLPIIGLAAWAYVQTASPLDQVTRPFIVIIATLAVSSALCAGVRAGIGIGETPVNQRHGEIEDGDYEIYEILQMN